MAKNKKDDDRPLHERFAPATLSPMGAEDKQKDQGNLIAAKQLEMFPHAGGLLAHALTRRGERIMLDYAQAGVGVKFDVDGLWTGVDPYDRTTGDGILAVLKKIANLNPQERRAKQEGKFGVEFHGQKFICELISQGVKTGERVLIKMVPKKAKFETIDELGMRPKMRARFKELVDQDHGIIVFSAPPGHGLTTLWNLGLNTSDRFVRDFIALEDEAYPDEEIINVGPIYFKASEGQSPATLLPKLLLKQPDVFVVPDMVDAESMKILCDQVNKNSKMVMTRTRAKDAIEALLRILMLKGPAEDFADGVTMSINSRLIRKLCESCRQSYQPTPQMLQKLGIPAGRVQHLYREFQMPPPDQQVDEKGRPIEIEICKDCGGTGYLGRTAIFEMLEVTDEIRKALKSSPKLDSLRKVARAGGHRNLQEEGILLVAQGVTSLPELQRVMKL